MTMGAGNAWSETGQRAAHELADEILLSAMERGMARGLPTGGVLAALTLAVGWLVSLAVSHDGGNVDTLVGRIASCLREIVRKEAARRNQIIQ